MTQTTVLPTLDQLRRVYPTLRMLEAEAEDFQSNADPNFCANEVWHRSSCRQQSLRNRVVTIAEKAVKRFGNQRVYDLIYEAVYQRLPNCRRCGCFNPEALT